MRTGENDKLDAKHNAGVGPGNSANEANLAAFFYSFHSPLSPFSFLLFFLFFLHFRTMSKSNVVTLFVHPRICRDFQEIDANFCIFEQLCTVSKRS